MSVAQEYLDRIDEMLASYDEVTADSLVKEVCSAFAGTIPEIKAGLDRYRARISVGGQQVTYDNKGDLMKLRSKLRLYVEKSEPTKSGNPVSGFFNLVVDANADNPMPGSRMLETLAPDARDLVMPGGSIDMAALCALPTVIMPEFAEDDSQAQAVVGYLDGTSRAPAISRPVMTVPSRALLDRGVVSGGWLGERTRWDVLEGDPFKLLAGCCTVLSTAQPSDGESACVDPHLVAVMMPFRAEPALDNVYTNGQQKLSPNLLLLGLNTMSCRKLTWISARSAITISKALPAMSWNGFSGFACRAMLLAPMAASTPATRLHTAPTMNGVSWCRRSAT